MNYHEMQKVLSILSAAYPNFGKDRDRAQAEQMCALWTDIFEDVPGELMFTAIKDIIRVRKNYPPDIATVSEHIEKLRQAATDEPTDEELWKIYKRAVQNSGSYEADKKNFNNLPLILQTYVVHPRTLTENGLIPERDFDTVVHGQFLKEIRQIREKTRTQERIAADPKLAKTVQQCFKRPDEPQNLLE